MHSKQITYCIHRVKIHLMQFGPTNLELRVPISPALIGLDGYTWTIKSDKKTLDHYKSPLITDTKNGARTHL